MAQWQALQGLDSGLQGQVSQLYERRFPREIRHSLCTVIESQDWDVAAEDENKASTCFCALLVYLDEQWSRSVQDNIILQGPDFPGIKDYLMAHFKDEPLKLAAILSECLKEEKNILAAAAEAQGCGAPTTEQKWRLVDNKVSELKRRTLEVKKEIKSLDFLNEKLDFIQVAWQNKVEQHIGLARSQAAVEVECLKQARFITQTKQMLLQQLVGILNLAEEVVLTLTDVELPEWKRRQQAACIGCPVDACLDHLQKQFTAAAEVLLDVREQLQKLREQNKKYSSTDTSALVDTMEAMDTFTLTLCTKLLSNALVVEKQPVMSSSPQRPLILKTGVRFTVTVRFLANHPEFKCRLKVKPVFDKDVEEVKTIKGFRHFEFDRDNSKVLDEDVSTGGLVAEFGLMSLKEKKVRGLKGSSEPRLVVTEELHIITFVTKFQHDGLECNIEASSLPVVVISSSNQIVSAWAAVMWCNMLCTTEPKNLSLFVDPPPLSWQQLSQVLGWQFLSVGQRGLDEDQLSMLRDKIVDNPDDVVHWSTFSKNESAWVWIEGILGLIRKHLVDLWRDGLIMGFVSRDRTRALLQEKETGTFLLRFSESIKDGAITFSWVDHSNGETHVHAVEPYNKQELSAMCLADIIYLYSLRAQTKMTRNPLVYLYPDVPKDFAFGRYYKTSATSTPKAIVDGYVDRTLIPVSVHPTPPPSPPREPLMMDMDMDMDMDANIDISQVYLELFSGLLHMSELPDEQAFDQQASPFQDSTDDPLSTGVN